jgi:phenylacetate-coenzyme A ligase PaaK-like adenylate-forming protein
VTGQEERRRRHFAEMLAALPEQVARLEWSRQAIESHRRRSLRLLLRVAKEYSPWHRERLRDIDPARATAADLEWIPPMTRDDLMDHWNEIVIYPSLELAQVEAHLGQPDVDAYLCDAFCAVASSGSSGRRGIFVYDWDAWITSFLGCARWRLRNRSHAIGSRRARVALVASEHPAHIRRKIHETFRVGDLQTLPATLPLERIVSGLNESQPHVLLGYPSMLRELCKAAHAGTLEIRPAYVHCSGEPLDPDLRRELSLAFGGRILDGWSASEALPLAQECSAGSHMHLNDDLVIVEPVDSEGGRVPPGTASSRVYLTNLYNLTLPLIRYELTDQVTVSCRSCPCGSAYTLLDAVGGRLGERFVYDDGVVVDAGAIQSVPVRERGVSDWQVVQTRDGAERRLRCERSIPLRAVAERVASALVKGGVASPAVRIRRVDTIERGPAGKLQRFVPQA